MKPWKPKFGERVTFTHYYDAPTRQEVQERGFELEGEEGTITLQHRQNPTPDKPAMVIGTCSTCFETTVEWNDDSGENYAWFRGGSDRRMFYVLKQSFRGRRYYVTAEDVQPHA